MGRKGKKYIYIVKCVIFHHHFIRFVCIQTRINNDFGAKKREKRKYGVNEIKWTIFASVRISYKCLDKKRFISHFLFSL